MNKFNKKKSSIADTYSFTSGASYTLLLILSFILLIISFVIPNSLTSLRSNTVDIFAPVIAFIAAPFQLISGNISSVSGVASLRAENVNLKSENARLKEWYQTALMLQAENKSLEKLLNVKIDTHQSYITARILSDNDASFVKTILVSAGEEDGVKKNQAVLSGEGIIGRVIEPGKNSARILLLTDVNSRLPVMIEGTNQKAILKGTNTQNPILKHLPDNIGAIDNSRIVTSGDGGLFPASLPVGRVVKKDGQYKVQLYGEIDKISYVRIVDTTSPENLIRDNFGNIR